MFSGRVYNKQSGEAIVGVAVSDGRNLTLTDKDGAFSLVGYEGTSMIYVCALTNSHDDWYILTDGRESYDFYISPAEQKPTVKYLHTSDTEIGSGGCGRFIDFISRTSSLEKVDFLIHTGDICRRDGLERHFKDMNFETVGAPVRYTLGNHDFVNDKYGEYTYERLYGPTSYSFNFGSIHFIVLPIRRGEALSGYAPTDSYLWLKNDLALCPKGMRAVIFRHDRCEDKFVLRLCDGEELNLKDHGLLLWQYGHYHFNFSDESSEVKELCTGRPDSGGIDQSAASARVTEISCGCDISSKIIYNIKQNGILTDAPIKSATLGSDVYYSDPILIGDDLYVLTSSDDLPKSCGLYKLSTSKLSPVLLLETENSVKNEAVVSEGVLYFEDVTGNVYAFDTEAQKLLWKRALPLPELKYTAKGVTLDGDVLFAGSERLLFALDKKSGDVLYESDEIKKFVSSTSRYVISGDKLLVGLHWQKLYCYAKNDLSVLWENAEIIDSTATPLAFDGVVYASARKKLYKISLETGETLLSKEYPENFEFNSVGSPVLWGDSLLVPTSTHGVVEFDRDTLEFIREYPAGEAIVPTATYTRHDGRSVMHTPIVSEDHLVFAASDGALYNYSLSDGVLVSKIQTNGPILVKPIVIGDRIILFDLFGNVSLYPFSLNN